MDSPNNTPTLTLTREDLHDGYWNLPIDRLALSHFDVNKMAAQMAHKVTFIDDDGTAKVLKDRSNH